MINPLRFALTVGAALTVLAGAAGEGVAQQRRGPGPRAGDRAQLEERVRARFGEMIRARLGLTEEESARLGDVMHSFMERRQGLFQEEQALRRRTEALLLEEDASGEEAASVLSRMTALRMEEARLFQAEQEALLQVLTPLQLVRFHAMREQLSQRVQQLRGGDGPMVPGRGPPGGGADRGPQPFPFG